MRKIGHSAIVLVTLIGFLTLMGPARASGSDESDFTARLNNERGTRGLAALSADSGLATIARRQAQRMANENRLYHNPNLGYEVQDWRALGENVGEGSTVEEIHRAFMQSESHRDQILGDYRKVGVGVVVQGGTIWVSQVFVLPKVSTSSTSSTSSTASAPAPAPRPVAQPAVRRSSRTSIAAVRHVRVRPLPRRHPKAASAKKRYPAMQLSHGKIEKLLGDLASIRSDTISTTSTFEKVDLPVILRGFVSGRH